MFRTEVVLSAVFLFLTGCKGCVEQHDPSEDWKRFEEESSQANGEEPKLTDDGSLPAEPAGDGEAVAQSPVDQKYSQFCATCHGETGEGNGPAGTALNPPPRNFVTWNDDVSDEHIATVIRDGGPAVGLSPTMAPWGSVLSEAEITGLVEKIRNFRNP